MTGNIIIQPQKKDISLVVLTLNESKNAKEAAKHLADYINKSYAAWDLTNFNEFEKIVIPINFKVSEHSQRLGLTYKDFPDTNYKTAKMKALQNDAQSIFMATLFFFKDDGEEKNTSSVKFAVNVKDVEKSKQNNDQAIIAFEKNNYLKAASLFQIAFDLDNRNIDALYNVSSIYTAQNKIKEACAALKILKDLDQTEGTKLYNEKCLNIN